MGKGYQEVLNHKGNHNDGDIRILAHTDHKLKQHRNGKHEGEEGLDYEAFVLMKGEHCSDYRERDVQES